MIHSFSLRNFYSFADKAELSFEVSDKAPNNKGYVKSPSGIRLSKIETVIGPNASGKTNLLKVLPMLKFLIVDSFILEPSSPIAVQSYMFGKYQNEPSELSAEFEINNIVYIYSFILNKERIISEKLRKKNKSNNRVTTKTLFSREWDEVNNKYSFNGKNFGFPKNFENTLRSNASVIAVAVRFNHLQSKEISDFWTHVDTNVIEGGWIGEIMPNKTAQMFDAFDFFTKNKELKIEAEKVLSRFDIGLEALEFKRGINELGPYINIEGIHSIKGQKKTLSFKYESSGTKQLIVLLKTILNTLDKGGIAVLDEMDVNLHPEIVLSLVDLFLHLETNPKNAQIIFSTHSLLVLNRLDKYQIVFTEKNSEGKSETWRLDELSDVRSDENYYSKYIAGAYGALPDIK